MQREISISGFEEVYDILGIMLFKLNPTASYAKRYALPGYIDEDMETLEMYLKQFSIVDSKFKLLLDIEQHNISFLSEYFEDIKKERGYIGLEDFIKVISKDERFKKKVILFYLGDKFDLEKDLQKSLLFECKALDLQYRYMLLQFIEFFDDYMAEFFQNMRSIKRELEDVYSKHKQLLKKITDSFNLETLQNARKMIWDWAENKTRIQVTFSLSNQYLVLMGSYNEFEGWMILGVNYQSRIERQWHNEISVMEMCNALSDETRFKIVMEVWYTGEVTPTLISKKFGLPYSIVCYHLDILRKSKILCTQLNRRNTVYQMNVVAIKELSEAIAKLGEKNDERKKEMD